MRQRAKGRDTLVDLEAVEGTFYNDRLTGDGANAPDGYLGSDTIAGGAGDDFLGGGGGGRALRPAVPATTTASARSAHRVAR